MTPLQSKSFVTAPELERLARAGAADILDVRSPAEFGSAHIPGAVLAPLDTLDAAAFLKARSDQSKPICVVCQSGARARKAMEYFQCAGFDGCLLLEGGTQAWMDAGLPVIRSNHQTLSLMRQVQITIGVISGVGAGLALTVHRDFAVLPLFTGCGLLFAGLSGTCGLALLLAKMPWNQIAPNNSRTCCGGKE